MNQLCLAECLFWRGKDMTNEKKRVSKDVCSVTKKGITVSMLLLERERYDQWKEALLQRRVRCV
jgi:hypothetical protein